MQQVLFVYLFLGQVPAKDWKDISHLPSAQGCEKAVKLLEFMSVLPERDILTEKDPQRLERIAE